MLWPRDEEAGDLAEDVPGIMATLFALYSKSSKTQSVLGRRFTTVTLHHVIIVPRKTPFSFSSLLIFCVSSNNFKVVYFILRDQHPVCYLICVFCTHNFYIHFPGEF